MSSITLQGKSLMESFMIKDGVETTIINIKEPFAINKEN